MTVQSFDEVYEILEQYAPLPRAIRSADKLESMQELMVLLGNPEKQFQTIHIAGTSGKTSTAYYVAAMLAATGRRVGLTISPHIIEVNERVQLNMVPLEEAAYCVYFSKFLTVLKASKLKPTYFQLLTAFAFWVFAQEKVEYAVVEVGIGGLLDATNIFTRHDKICVITDIGLDHTEKLGKTITEITSQKAGIIQPSNVVFAYDQGDEIMGVLREVSEQQNAELHEIWPLKQSELPHNLPLFQRRNWYLAWSVSQYIIEVNHDQKLSDKALALTSQTYIPGRMEIIEHNGKTLILDGAHNAQKLEALAESVKDAYPDSKYAVLFSLAKSKKHRLHSSTQAVTGLADYLLLTAYDTGKRLRRQSADPARVAEQCHLLEYDTWDIEANPHKAFQSIMKRSEQVVVITGSFYIIEQLKNELYGRSQKHSSS